MSPSIAFHPTPTRQLLQRTVQGLVEACGANGAHDTPAGNPKGQLDVCVRHDYSRLHHGSRTGFIGPPGSRPSRVSFLLRLTRPVYIPRRCAKHVPPARSQYFYHIYLRTLSANETHPQAGSPFLPFLRTSQVAGGIDHVPAYRLRILDDLIGTLAKEVVDEVGGYSAFMEIWNWKHGARGSVSFSSSWPPFPVHI
jgi:hypothetical protein